MRSRTYKAVIVALVAVLVLTVRGAQKQRRAYAALGVPRPITAWQSRRMYRRRLHAVAGLLLVNAIGDAADSILGFFSDVSDSVKNFVSKMIAFVGGII